MLESVPPYRGFTATGGKQWERVAKAGRVTTARGQCELGVLSVALLQTTVGELCASECDRVAT